MTMQKHVQQMGDRESCEVEITIGEPGDPTDVVDAVNEGTYLQAL